MVLFNHPEWLEEAEPDRSWTGADWVEPGSDLISRVNDALLVSIETSKLVIISS